MSVGETTLQKEEATTPVAERTTQGRVFVPRVDIVETDDAILMVGDFPGVDEHGMDITLEKNVLTIRGRVTPHFPEGASPLLLEYEIGDFERTFTISDEVDREKIEATVKDGVLRLYLPKAKHVLSQKIPVVAR